MQLMTLLGVVDTEGLWDHAKLAKESGLPHAAYFDKLREDPEGMSSPEYVAKFLSFLLENTTNEELSLKEWHIKMRVLCQDGVNLNLSSSLHKFNMLQNQTNRF